MREPAFWHRPPALLARLLSPLGAIYGAVTASRMQSTGVSAGIPTFCVGNYHMGGAGKTPTVLALAALLNEMDETAVVLTRGYGGRLQGPVKVDPQRHAAADVGDEPLMMAQTLPVVVSRDRIEGVALARSRNPGVILMDDGFQNPALAKDVSFVVIDSHRGLGNGHVFPAGPMRAPLSPQLEATDALVVIGEGRAAENVMAAVRKQSKPVFSARLVPIEASVAPLRGQRVLAFAGIGDPGRFFRSLRSSGIDVAAEVTFADHHPFSTEDVDALVARARRDGLRLVTTEKDIARLRSNASAADIATFKVTLDFDDRAAVVTYLGGRLFAARQRYFI